MYVSLMCVYRCRQFVDINCRLQLYKLEAKKKNQKKIPSLSNKDFSIPCIVERTRNRNAQFKYKDIHTTLKKNVTL
jgi:hypothetical protein